MSRITVREREPDLLAVANKRPERHYRWVRDDSTAITMAKLQGYEPEKQVSQSGMKVPGSGSTAEGFERRGDLILFSCPQEQYEQRQSERAQWNRDKLDAATARLELEAARAETEVLDVAGPSDRAVHADDMK